MGNVGGEGVYGVYDLNTVTVLKKLGFKLAFTVNSGFSDSSNNRYALPRIMMSQNDTMTSFIRKVSTGK